MARQYRVLRWFFVANYLVVALILGDAVREGFSRGAGGFLFALGVALTYALLFMGPAAIVGIVVSRFFRRTGYVLSVLLAAFLLFALYADLRVYSLYGFHFNGFVWNLLTTPGGVASMGGSDDAVAGVIAIGAAMLVAEAAGLYAAVLLVKKGLHIPRGRLRYAIGTLFVALICVQLSYGYGRILAWQPVLMTARDVPLFIPTHVVGLADAMGIKARREPHSVKSSGTLNYPLHPIQVGKKADSPNFIWLVSESLRWDMLTPEIMPNLWQFAKGAHRFTDNFSGGNGTRMGVFSMFYGLPGSYWFPFLDERKEPVFIKLLQQRHYQLGLYTSSKFTYPEFDKTVFADVPANKLHSDDADATWKADRRNVKRLIDFIDKAHNGERPYFAFMFFNSPHARYYFPPESVIRPNYLKNFNYAREDVAAFRRDIKLIKNRYINSVHHLDQQLGKVFDYVRAHDLKKDTIIIITGDHAEEFMDAGRWGHNSELHSAQLHTPMVLWIPGKGSGVHHWPTSHMDLVPTVLPLMGVTNPPRDYTEGRNMFDPDPQRFRMSASWESLAYVGPKYKVSMPLRAGGMGQTAITTLDDKPVADPDKVLEKLQPRILQVLSDLSRYYRK